MKRLSDRHPYNEKRSRKRPNTRRWVEMEKFVGVAWQRMAQDRQLWKELGNVRKARCSKASRHLDKETSLLSLTD